MKLTLLAVLLLAPLAKLQAVDTPKPRVKPNIILCLIDDLGWRDLGCQGSTFYQTPNIDQLAKDGVRFTDAYAACAVCSPWPKPCGTPATVPVTSVNGTSAASRSVCRSITAST